MNTPISVLIEGNGEEMFIRTLAVPANYDPNSPTSYDPGTDPNPGKRVWGAIADRKMREGMPATAKAAVVIEAYSMPEGLQPMQSSLYWTSILWTIVDFRERRWQGEIDGYTLFLAK